jgi:signal peptidase I
MTEDGPSSRPARGTGSDGGSEEPRGTLMGGAGSREDSGSSPWDSPGPRDTGGPDRSPGDRAPGPPPDQEPGNGSAPPARPRQPVPPWDKEQLAQTRPQPIADPGPAHLRETRPQYVVPPKGTVPPRSTAPARDGFPSAGPGLSRGTAPPRDPVLDWDPEEPWSQEAARNGQPPGNPQQPGRLPGQAWRERSLTGPLIKLAETTGPIVRQAGTRLAALHARQRRKFWRELPVLVVIAIVLALVIKTYVVQAFYIPSGSMQNTLAIGDRVLINKVVYHTRGIDRGDIVVFNGDGSWDPVAPPQDPNPVARLVDALEGIVGITHGSDVYIKRVIGLPGDRVQCCDTQGRVTVNGAPLTEQDYLYPGNKPSTPFRTVIVPPGHLWVMGDHRDVSFDSRGHEGDPGGGAIPESSVMGRAFVVIWPPSKWGFLNIPATFSQPRLTGSAAAALDTGPVRVRPASSPLPLALGAAGAVPLTWIQRKVRTRRPRRHQRSR